MDFHSITLTPLRFQRPVSSVMLWLPSGFPFRVRRGMIGLWLMPHDTFTYYLLKVGFMPPLRAHLTCHNTRLQNADQLPPHVCNRQNSAFCSISARQGGQMESSVQKEIYFISCYCSNILFIPAIAGWLLSAVFSS